MTQLKRRKVRGLKWISIKLRRCDLHFSFKNILMK